MLWQLVNWSWWANMEQNQSVIVCFCCVFAHQDWFSRQTIVSKYVYRQLTTASSVSKILLIHVHTYVLSRSKGAECIQGGSSPVGDSSDPLSFHRISQDNAFGGTCWLCHVVGCLSAGCHEVTNTGVLSVGCSWRLHTKGSVVPLLCV